MNYWTKNPKSAIKTSGLHYDSVRQRLELKRLLLTEQKGFCAYSERYIQNTDAHDVEHFDPRIKTTTADNYENWYAVRTWINNHKPKNLDKRFLPILHPKDVENGRIWYGNGILKQNKAILKPII